MGDLHLYKIVPVIDLKNTQSYRVINIRVFYEYLTCIIKKKYIYIYIYIYFLFKTYLILCMELVDFY